MNRRGVLIAVAVFVALMLFFAPWILRMQADAGGITGECALLWTPEHGIVELCNKLFLPLVEKCSECMSAWPVWPGKGE